MKVKIKSIVQNGIWYNVNLEDGRAFGCNSEKNPKTKAALDDIVSGKNTSSEIECDLVSKDGKNWMFDIKDQAPGKSGGKFAPKNERAIIAQSSISSAIDFYKGTTADREEVFSFASDIFEWVIKKGNVN